MLKDRTMALRHEGTKTRQGMVTLAYTFVLLREFVPWWRARSFSAACQSPEPPTSRPIELQARIPARFSDASELNEFLMKEAGVAGVPGSAFMDDPEEDVYMRLCFARENAMLEAAAHRIVKALA